MGERRENICSYHHQLMQFYHIKHTHSNKVSRIHFFLLSHTDILCAAELKILSVADSWDCRMLLCLFVCIK